MVLVRVGISRKLPKGDFEKRGTTRQGDRETEKRRNEESRKGRDGETGKQGNDETEGRGIMGGNLMGRDLMGVTVLHWRA